MIIELPRGQGQLSGIWKVQRDWLSLGKENVVLVWAGVCGKGRNTSSPENTCVGSYAKASETNYARSIFCRCHCPSSGSLILGGQIVHINEGKDKLALFSFYLLRPPPTPPQLTYFPFLIFLFSFYFPSTTSTSHQSHIDHASTFCFNIVYLYWYQSWIVKILHHRTTTVFTPPSPPPHFYCFHSTYMSLIDDCGTKLLLSSYETTISVLQLKLFVAFVPTKFSWCTVVFRGCFTYQIQEGFPAV